MRISLARTFALTLALLGAAGTAVAQDRVIAVGDVHGAYAEFDALLRKVGLVDTGGHWVGGKTTFVSLGDLTNATGPQTIDFRVTIN